MSETFTTKDVAARNTVEKGLYIIIDNDVYSVASFVDEHPGGAKILKRVGGKDASKQFWKVRRKPNTLLIPLSLFNRIGLLDIFFPWKRLEDDSEEML